jgi:hypothetical protein
MIKIINWKSNKIIKINKMIRFKEVLFNRQFRLIIKGIMNKKRMKIRVR